MKKLISPKEINEIKRKYNFSFNKKYGQNFLIDHNIVDKILSGAEVNENDYIIEIGPGFGTLTQYLCERAGNVLAVEVDKKLLPVLKETLQEYKNVVIVNEDILKVDLKAYLDNTYNRRYKVIANLPYYITSEIIMSLLEGDLPLESITVMVQREVAERMIASPGTKEYGALSVAVQFYSKPEIVTVVPKTVFIPQPNVESAVIKLNLFDKAPVDVTKQTFFKIVKASFSMRRKTLLNCLSSKLNMDKSKIRGVLSRCGIDYNRRGETLNIDEFAKIANEVDQLST